MRTLFEASPTVAIVAVLIVAVLHWREWSVESARKRVLFQATPVGYALGGKFTRAYALGIEIETATWKSRPATWLLRDWIRAAVYEVSGARKHGWLIAASTPVVFNCAIAYGFGLSEFAATFGLMQLSLMEARLLGDWAYPITRKDRATLAFVCSLLQNAAYFFPAMALWWWLDQTELPRLPFAEEPRSVPWGLAMFPIAFIWGPVVQWVRATSTSPLRDRLKTTGWTIRSFVHVIGGVVLTVTTAHAITDWLRPQSTTLAIVAMIVLAATVHLGYWLALRWHFSRRDLV